MTLKEIKKVTSDILDKAEKRSRERHNKNKNKNKNTFKIKQVDKSEIIKEIKQIDHRIKTYEDIVFEIGVIEKETKDTITIEGQTYDYNNGPQMLTYHIIEVRQRIYEIFEDIGEKPDTIYFHNYIKLRGRLFFKLIVSTRPLHE